MVGQPDRLDPIKKIGEEKLPGGPTPGPGPESFESYMEKAGQQASMAGKAAAPSPMELAQPPSPLTTGPTFDSLLGQARYVQGMLGDIQDQLQTKNLKLKQSDRASLRSKLKNANSYLKAANVKLGAEVPEPPTPSGGGIIGKFLDYVTEGQANLAAAQQQIMSLKSKGDSLKPADFLAIQVKIAHAQQEIEYASMMLANAVSGLKTLFGIQL